MKKLALFLAAGLLMGGVAFAEEENGALGFGIMSESGKDSLVSSSIRGTLFLDIGYQLAGPLYYGFEFQGDVKQMSQESFKISKTDVTAYDLGGGDFAIFYDRTDLNTTYTLWDLDFSPRGYISFDLGDKIQLLGFGGLNYNWQTLDYTVENLNTNSSVVVDGVTIDAGDDHTWSQNVGNGFFSIVAGFRVTVGAFYGEYTRFLDDSSEQVSWNAYSKDRLSIGINLRF